MLAATTCSSVGSPAARREKRLRARQHGAGSARRRRARGGSTATQSPTAGKSARAARLVPQPARHAREPLPVRRHHAVDVRVLEADARRARAPRRAMRRERLGEARRSSRARRDGHRQASERAEFIDRADGRTATRVRAARRPSTRAACRSAVFSRQRSTSATLHACAMQPRGVYGGSASKISLIEPMHASLEMRVEPVEQRARAGAIVRVDLQPGVDERADQPGPDRALMIGGVARRADRRSTCAL